MVRPPRRSPGGSERGLRPLLAGAVALLWAAGLAGAAETEPPAPRTGGVVPDFRLFDMAQHSRRLGEFTAPVLVLNFWAFWCDTWKAQLPQLQKLARRQDELGFDLVAVSVDGQWSEARWRHPGAGPLLFPVLLDSRSQVSRALGLRRVPTVLVLDRRRRVTWLREAYPGNPAVIQAILSAQRPGQ